jgi:bifunctional DNase/RNase
MEKKKVELYVYALTPNNDKKTASVTLRESEGSRSMLLLVGKEDMISLISEYTGSPTSQPLMYSLFAGCLEMLRIQMTRALIYKTENGLLYSYIYMKVEGALIRMDARVTDAILMAMRMKAPIFIYEEVLEAELLRQQGILNAGGGLTLQPDKDEFLISDSIEILKKAQQRAVDAENYEIAAQLQKEIEKQQEQKDQ